MKRLQQAGLNPNLVYGGNTATMPSATASPAQQPQTSPIDTQAVMHAVQLVVQGMLEKDKIQANKELQKASIASQQSMQEKQIQSSESMQEKQIQSSELMQEKTLNAEQEKFQQQIIA